nr:YciI family protein [Kribbella sp. VKM Ac-2568]
MTSSRPAASASGTARANRIQQAHLDFLDSLRQRGLMAAAGPFRDGMDATLSGLCIYRVGVEEARQYAAEDPAVQAGWLDPEALTWWFRAGEVRLPGVP